MSHPNPFRVTMSTQYKWHWHREHPKFWSHRGIAYANHVCRPIPESTGERSLCFSQQEEACFWSQNGGLSEISKDLTISILFISEKQKHNSIDVAEDNIKNFSFKVRINQSIIIILLTAVMRTLLCMLNWEGMTNGTWDMIIFGCGRHWPSRLASLSTPGGTWSTQTSQSMLYRQRESFYVSFVLFGRLEGRHSDSCLNNNSRRRE